MITLKENGGTLERIGQISPVASQVFCSKFATTNNVESWHSSLKHGVKQVMKHWALLGIVMHVANVAAQWDLRAEEAEKSFRTKHLSDSMLLPGIRKLPCPAQKLVLDQLTVGRHLVGTHAVLKEFGDNVECDCLFFRSWALPCCHLFHRQLLFGGVLDKDEDWTRYGMMFENCGFEIYEGRETIYTPDQLDDEIGVPIRRRLEVREILDNIQSRFYDVEELTANMSPADRDDVFARWITNVRRITGEIFGQAVEEFLEGTSVPWKWVEERISASS